MKRRTIFAVTARPAWAEAVEGNVRRALAPAGLDGINGAAFHQGRAGVELVMTTGYNVFKINSIEH